MRNGLKSIVTVFVLGFVFFSSPLASRGEKHIGTNDVQNSNGRILYVGGTGPGNYSKIQDAIDSASDNDTIYVYDDSSPYHENILIDKSITLLGENKTTTAVDAQGIGGNVVSISADRVIFSGFSVLNWGLDIYSPTGMYIHANDCKILGNIISCNYWRGYEAIKLNHSNNNSILNNIISHNDLGITVESSSQTIISKNLIEDSFGAGILLRFSNDNNISENIIENNTYGMDVGNSFNNKINSNEISYNTYGITISYSLKNIITENNFRKNIGYDAYNIFSFQPFWRNTWDANYWNRGKLLPQIIFGYLESYKNILIIIPWINVDWRPAQKPYDISILN